MEPTDLESYGYLWAYADMDDIVAECEETINNMAFAIPADFVIKNSSLSSGWL